MTAAHILRANHAAGVAGLYLPDSIDIGNGRRCAPNRARLSTGAGMFVRTDVDQRGGVTVVGGIHHDEVALPACRRAPAAAPARSPRCLTP